jgi:hypothetical protein
MDQLSPELQALINRVQEIGRANHEALVAENKKMIAEAIERLTAQFKSPVAEPSPAQVAKRGLHLINTEVAREFDLLQSPKKGLKSWQIILAASLSAALAAGAASWIAANWRSTKTT